MSVPATITVLSSPPLRAVFAELKPQFEHATRQTLLVETEPAAELKRRIDRGDAFDVAILTSGLIDTLINEGKIAASTRRNIARAGLGVVVRAVAAKPDVSSIDAFKHALLSAKSILYASGSAVLGHIERTLERLEIAESLRSKSRTLPAGGYIAKAVADGVAELGLTTIPTILETGGAKLAGPFPDALQFHVHLSGGISTASRRPAPAQALLRSLMAPETTSIIHAKGLQRITGNL